MAECEEKSEQESSKEEDSDSSGSNLDFSSDDDILEVSDLDKFEETHKEFRDFTDGVDPSALSEPAQVIPTVMYLDLSCSGV